MTGTFINIGTVLAGTLVGTLAGNRLPEGVRRRVLAGLGLITLVLGIDNALAWRHTNPSTCSPACCWAGSPARPSGSRDG